MHHALFYMALLSMLTTPVVLAADGPDLTIYRSTNHALFQSGQGAVNSGYAVVHEQRSIGYSKGTQELLIADLPDYLEPEAVALRFRSDHVQILSQRLLLAQGRNSALSGQIGKQVDVIGDNGQLLVKGKLERVDHDGSLVIGGDVFGPTIVQHYSAVKLINGDIGGGSRLQLRTMADNNGHSDAMLSYPTHGLGWRAAYTATLQPGNRCRMRLRAEASIANRSGRDWNAAGIKLLAGRPNIGSANNGRPPLLMMHANAKGRALPAQSTLDAYRSYTLPDRIDLPDNSITLTPLYHPRTMDCKRTWTFESGNTWIPSRPLTSTSKNAQTIRKSVSSVLRLQAPDTLPEGHMRVLVVDSDNSLELVGEGVVTDTPKHAEVRLTLGTAFDLRAKRERTRFQYNKSKHHLTEAFRVTLTNTGSSTRTISVIDHPNRWNQWSLIAASSKPSQQTTDTLAFQIKVPTNKTVTLNYTLRYQWAAMNE